MAEIVLAKTATGALAPIDQQGIDYLKKLKVGQGVKCKIVRHRNLGHHRKYFALLNFAFDQWEPQVKMYRGMTVQKDFDQFRNDITILAGHFDTSVNLRGEVRLRAKSIAFENMDQDEFESLYQRTITVILEKVLRDYSREDLDRVVDQILGFT